MINIPVNRDDGIWVDKGFEKAVEAGKAVGMQNEWRRMLADGGDEKSMYRAPGIVLDHGMWYEIGICTNR